MSWLDDMTLNLKDANKDTSLLLDLEKDRYIIEKKLKTEFYNATSIEIERAVDYVKEKSEALKLSFGEILKIARVKLED